MGADTDPEPRGGDDSGPTFEESGRSLVYLAAERTLLSWVRAAISFMVLGFAVDRFGLLLATTRGGPRPSPASAWVGIALILAGIVASVAAAVRYQRFAARYGRGDLSPGPGLPLAVAFTWLLGLLGAALAAYLWLSAR